MKIPSSKLSPGTRERLVFLVPAPPTPQGLALIFIPARGGTPPPWTPSPPPVDPLPPTPLSSSAPENLGFGNIF